MKAMTLENDLLDDKIYGNEAVLRRVKRGWTMALFISSVLGIVSGSVGLVISGLNLLEFLTRSEGIGRLSTILVVLAFPLMMFGAHAMDKIAEIDRLQKSQKMEKEKRKQYSPEQWKSR